LHEGVPSDQLDHPIADIELARDLPTGDPSEERSLTLEECALPPSQALGDAT